MRTLDMIDRARQALGLTFKEFAEFLGVQASTLARWRNESRRLPNLADAFLRLVLADPSFCERVLAGFAPVVAHDVSSEPTVKEARTKAEAWRAARAKDGPLEPPNVAPAGGRSRSYEEEWDFQYVQRELLAGLRMKAHPKRISVDEVRSYFARASVVVQDEALLALEERGLLVLEPPTPDVEVKRPLRVEDRGDFAFIRLAHSPEKPPESGPAKPPESDPVLVPSTVSDGGGSENGSADHETSMATTDKLSRPPPRA